MSADTNSHTAIMSLHAVTVELDERLTPSNATFDAYADI